MIEEIGPLAARHGVGPETLAGALEEALLEVGASGKDKEVSAEELRSCLLGLVLWKIFGRGPWIRSKTGAGHEVPPDVLVTAYAMWGKAVSLATRYGVDTAAAAEALAAATHAITEKLAGSGQEGVGKEICDIGNYLFTAYMNLRNMLALTTVALFCFAGVGISASDALAQQRHASICDRCARRAWPVPSAR